MKNIKYYIKIYFMIAAQYLKERLQFRVDFAISILGMIFVNLIAIVNMYVIFNNIETIGGWGYWDMLFMYGFSLIAMSPQQLLLDNGWQLPSKVMSGDFIKYCFRPVNILFYYMSEVVDIKGFSQFILGIVILVLAWKKHGIPFNCINAFMLLIFMFSSILICMALMIVSSAMGFLGGGTNSMMMLASDLKGYSTYPLDIFGKVLKVIFTFILPIGFIAYYPVQFFLNKGGNVSLVTYLSPFIGVLFFYISCKIWITAANNYSGTGS